jgi:hypothetical protein
MPAEPEAVVTGQNRRLIICCDGTWDAADKGPAASNVVRMLRCIAPQAANGMPQIVWYHPGVGTGNPLDRLLGGGVGVGLAPNIRAAYAFLVNNYVVGDEIFLFGFSRGAYTARSLGGLIGVLGLLHPREMGDFMEAWDWYRLRTRPRDMRALDGRFPLRTRDVPIMCIGVWDTVGALGVPRNRLARHWHPCAENYQFYDTTLGTHVKYAFQALAIDERREPFQPVLWNTTQEPAADQVIRQVWFAGVHVDIGGGYPEHGAADLSFLWMLAQVDPLLTLDLEAVLEERDTTEPYAHGTLHESFKGPLWRWAGQKHRTVGPGANQFVHETALDRRGYKDYPRNPDFDFDKLPAWPRDAFEKTYAWSVTARPLEPPHLPGPARTFCTRMVHWLEGS